MYQILMAEKEVKDRDGNCGGNRMRVDEEKLMDIWLWKVRWKREKVKKKKEKELFLQKNIKKITHSDVVQYTQYQVSKKC